MNTMLKGWVGSTIQAIFKSSNGIGIEGKLELVMDDCILISQSDGSKTVCELERIMFITKKSSITIPTNLIEKKAN